MVTIVDANTGDQILQSQAIGTICPAPGDFMMINGIEYLLKKRLFGPQALTLFVSQVNPVPNVPGN